MVVGRGSFLHVSARGQEDCTGALGTGQRGVGSWVVCEALLVSLSLRPDNGPREILILDSVTVTLYGKKDFADGIQ